MGAMVEMPLWLVVVVLVLAAIASLDRIIGPGLRWYFRRRMQRAVDRLNTRLDRPIQPFKLMRRQDNVVRLAYDPLVMEAVAAHAAAQGVPQNVAFEQALGYAREIVPGFSTAAYFGFAIRVARWLSGMFYTVTLDQSAAPLREIDPKSAVVFVINHRSNMDYVLITWLAADRSALSYAVGEWARIWPLTPLIKAMGAFFIRRKDSDPLYRAVLARYIQMSAREGMTQAMFPEGGLSLSGAVGDAKKGLLTYLVRDFSPGDGADVVFVPVALNYDHVLEDRLLIQAAISGKRRFRVGFVQPVVWVSRLVWRKLRGTMKTFGNAAVVYGTPLSLSGFLGSAPDAGVEELADALMTRIRRSVPVLPVPLTAAALSEGPATRLELEQRAERLLREMPGRNAIRLPAGQAIDDGLSRLLERRLIHIDAGTVRIATGQEDVIGYYAASIQQICSLRTV
ncbi:MAG: 1-acyl-sn-glycerol-3-phosphate acyltransferase [Paracoccaceae bacterium]